MFLRRILPSTCTPSGRSIGSAPLFNCRPNGADLALSQELFASPSIFHFRKNRKTGRKKVLKTGNFGSILRPTGRQMAEDPEYTKLAHLCNHLYGLLTTNPPIKEQHNNQPSRESSNMFISWALLQGEAGTDHPEARCDSRFACKHAECIGRSYCCFDRAYFGRRRRSWPER